jgi:cytochrome c
MSAINTLAQKIKTGGAGNWGRIPMPPHPNISDEDAKTMVTWILSLK